MVEFDIFPKAGEDGLRWWKTTFDGRRPLKNSFWTQNIFLTEIFLGHKFLEAQNFIGPKKCWAKIFFGTNYFGPKIFCWPKSFSDPTFFTSRNFFRPKFVLDPKIFPTQIFFFDPICFTPFFGHRFDTYFKTKLNYIIKLNKE